MQEERKQEKRKRITLVKMRKTHFKTEDGRVENLEQSSPADFDAFISKYIRIVDVDRGEWDLMMRWRAVNFALKIGKSLDFCDPVEDVVSVENQ
jgi:hypothetical protein